jgi:hypothetical protein
MNNKTISQPLQTQNLIQSHCAIFMSLLTVSSIGISFRFRETPNQGRQAQQEQKRARSRRCATAEPLRSSAIFMSLRSSSSINFRCCCRRDAA